MNVLRLSRPLTPLLSRSASTITTTSHTASVSNNLPISLDSVEAYWTKLSADEQVEVHRQLEGLQKKDWKELSIAEKKAAYYVAFGPHGPRTPVDAPGTGVKVVLGTLGLLAVSGVIFETIRHYAQPPPKTLTKEWQEAANERARENKLNPITGLSSEGYKGAGFVRDK